MTSKPEYERGYGDGYRWAIYWLHERAKWMNDPHAKGILNGAATNLGDEGKERMHNKFGINPATQAGDKP